MNEEYAKMIIGLPLFQGYTIHGAQFLLESGEIKEHEPGEVLCREGEAANFVLLVLNGNVEVFVEREGRSLRLAKAGGGRILGEVAGLGRVPGSALMRAKGKSGGLGWATQGCPPMLLGKWL